MSGFYYAVEENGPGGGNVLGPGPKSICCEDNAWANTRCSAWALHEIKTRKSCSHAHEQVSAFSSHGARHRWYPTHRLAGSQEHNPLTLHSNLTKAALPFNQQSSPHTVRGRADNGLSQKITFLLNPPVTTSERGTLPWGLSKPCPPLPPSESVKVMSCCF